MSDYHSLVASRRTHNLSNDPYLTYDVRRSLRHNDPSTHNHSSRGWSYSRPPTQSSHRRSRSFSGSHASRRAMTLHMAQQRSNQNSFKSQPPFKPSTDVADGINSSKVTFAPSPQYKSESKNSKIPGLRKLSISSFVKNTIMSITRSSPSLKRRNSFSEVEDLSKSMENTSLTSSFSKHDIPKSKQDSKNLKTNNKTNHVPGIIGIVNHGNSCFINAVVQCLSNIRPFLEFFLENCRLFEKPLTKSFANLLESIWLGKYDVRHSQRFRNVVASSFKQFVDDSQNDSQEFLLLLLDRIQQELLSDRSMKNKNDYNPTNNLLKQLFETKLTSCLTCLKCKQSSYTVDTQLTICLPIQEPVTVRIIHVPPSDQERQCLYAFRISSIQTIKNLLEVAGHKLRLHPRDIAFVHIDKKGRYRKHPKLSSTITSIMPFNYLFFVQLVNRRINNSPIHQSVTTKTKTLLNHDNGDNNHMDSRSKNIDNHKVVNGNGLNEDTQSAGEFVNIVAVPMIRATNGQLQRFGSLISLDITRTSSYPELQMSLLTRMKAYFATNFFKMKNIRSTFRMRVYNTCDDDDDDDEEDDYDEDSYLKSIDEMPLYSLLVERSLSFFEEGSHGAPYLRLVVEFEQNVREFLLRLDQDKFFAMDQSYHELDEKYNNNNNNSCDLMSCLETFTQKEQLGADDTWVCNECRSRRPGSIKNLAFTNLSEVLVILLKRFRQEGEERLKIETHVEFPINGLDLTRLVTFDTTSSLCLAPLNSSPENNSTKLNKTWDDAYPGSLRDLNSQSPVNEDLVYDLVAVCNHHGDLTNGHYTAYCKNPLNKTWYNFNDNKVEELPLDRIVTNSAYMLFYWRRGHRSQSGIDLINWLNNQPPINGVNSTDSSLLSFNGVDSQTSCSVSLDNLATNQIVSKANATPLKSILKPSQSMPFSPVRHKTSHVRICDNNTTSDDITTHKIQNDVLSSKPPASNYPHSNNNIARSTKSKSSKSLSNTSNDSKSNQSTAQAKVDQGDIKTMVLCPPQSKPILSTKKKTDELLRQMREQAFQDATKKSATLVFEKVHHQGSDIGDGRKVGNENGWRSGTNVINGKLPSKMESTV